MSVSILEALQNANYNINKNRHSAFAVRMGMEQLQNAVVLLEKGYGIHDEVDTLLEEHGTAEQVPEKAWDMLRPDVPS